MESKKKNPNTNELIYNTETDLKNKLMVTSREGLGVRGWSIGGGSD